MNIFDDEIHFQLTFSAAFILTFVILNCNMHSADINKSRNAPKDELDESQPVAYNNLEGVELSARATEKNLNLQRMMEAVKGILWWLICCWLIDFVLSFLSMGFPAIPAFHMFLQGACKSVFSPVICFFSNMDFRELFQKFKFKTISN